MVLSSCHAPPTLRLVDTNKNLKARRQKPQGTFMSWKTQAIIENYLCLRIVLKSYLFILFIILKPE
jgi:hypothetical protein